MKISTGFFILSSIYLICINQLTIVSASTGSSPNLENRRQRPRPFVRVPLGRPPVQYARAKSEPFGDFIVDDDDLFELSKRQTSDDYGHLRFGKRGEDSFDDYGHMRFGRSGSD